jgi:hypothetical protein
MSSIVRFIEKNMVQDVVYWGNPVQNGEGSYTYDTPVAIKCRWVDKEQIITTSPNFDGITLISRAEVYTTEVLDIESCLFLGTLDDIEIYAESSGTLAQPQAISAAYKIKRVEKVPELKSNSVFLLKYYLTPYIG